MLEIKNLCKCYGQTQALDNVQLSVGPGEIVGLFGENGAGKTTLMKCILQLILYDAGGITLDGKLITRQNIGRFSFATCEHSFFPALTAKAHREFYEEHFETFLGRRFEGLMDFFQLPMDKPIRSFSTGQKNQFEVIMALSQGADYILMDEPFAGNDVFNREDFYKVLLGILEPHETVILSTHLIEEVTGFIGRAVLLHKGQIAGDVQTTELDEQGKTLMDYVKETYSYQSDRVSRALTELTGDYVKKPMRECTGKEICMEWLYHIGVPEDQIEELASNSANTVPVMMPYIDAFFMPRAYGDRPKVVPDGAVNFAFLGQFAETPRDTIFTTEYSMRTGMEAVYTLLNVDRGVPEVWGSVYDVRDLLNATVQLRDGKKPTDMKLSLVQKVALEKALSKIKGTDIEKLLKEYNII